MEISEQRKRELKQMYKEIKPEMGVFIIKNKVNGRLFLNMSKDLKSTYNSHWFQLKMGSHRIREMQKDWKKYGENAFAFEVLEILEYDEKGEKTDYSEDLDIMKMIWMEKLNKDRSLTLYKK